MLVKNAKPYMKNTIALILFISMITLASASEDTSPLISPKQLQQDLHQLYEDLKSSHIALFANVTAQAYDNKFAEIRSYLNEPRTKLQAQILFQQFAAYGKVAHANISFPNDAYQSFRDSDGKAFPLYVEINESRWFVSEDYSLNALPKGTEITHINGDTVDKLLQRLQQHISADTPAIASSLLEFQLPQYLWLLEHMDIVTGKRAQLSEKGTITINKDGRSQTKDIAYLTFETLNQRIEMQADKEQPETNKLREYRVIKDTIGYLKPGPFYNAENPADVFNNTNFVAFVDDAFSALLKRNVETLIVDVRDNPGGTNSFSDALIAWFADKPFRFASEFLIRSSLHAEASNQRRLANSIEQDSASHQLAKAYQNHTHGSVFSFDVEEAQPRKKGRFTGEVYVLINRASYSNAASLAAIVQDYGFGKVAGEATADFATTYASMETFTLSNSGIEVGFPKAHIIRPSGDKTAGPVFPDIDLETPDIESLVRLISSTPKRK